MNPAAEIDSLITRFVAGQAFYDFWKAFMAFYEAFGSTWASRIQRRMLSVSSASSASRKCESVCVTSESPAQRVRQGSNFLEPN